MTVLCIACYFKGNEFIRACKQQGCRVLLITSQHLADEPWPRDHLDAIHYVPEEDEDWDLDNLIKGVSYLARTEAIDRIVPLDDYDLEKAAALREHLRVPGMGDTRVRYFRDKLAMRQQAQEAGIAVPAFVPVVNHEVLHAFTQQVPAPWVLKPRSAASAVGIKKIREAAQLWQLVEELGDEQSFYLLERFVPGDIYHVDSIVYDRQVLFARVHRYADPPMAVAHEGGVFATHSIEYGTDEEQALQHINREVIRAMGLLHGVSHTEFIQAHEDGRLYFLETSARVGGANIAEMLEASSGLNLWREWAKIEALPPGAAYTLPAVRDDHSGILLSLARQFHPDTSAYDDPEVVWRMEKDYHAGLIVASPSLDRVKELLASYTERFYHDFVAVQPLPDKPTS